MKPNRSKPEAAPEPAATEAGAAAPPPQVRFNNLMTQVLAVQLRGADGRIHHCEIPARGHLLWPAAESLAAYGPDAVSKIRCRHLSLEPAR